MGQIREFGVDDETLGFLGRYAKITEVYNDGDSLVISYQDKRKKSEITVRKSEVKKLDPKTRQVLKEEIIFVLDPDPRKKEVKYGVPNFAKGKEYTIYERDTTPDLTELIKKDE